MAGRLEAVGRQQEQAGRKANRKAVLSIMSAAVRLSDPSVRGDPDLEPALAGGAEVVGTDDRKGDASDLEYSLGWTSSGAFGLGEDLEGNLAGSGPDLELAESDFGETVGRSNDPTCRRRCSASTGISDQLPFGHLKPAASRWRAFHFGDGFNGGRRWRRHCRHRAGASVRDCRDRSATAGNRQTVWCHHPGRPLFRRLG